MNRCSSFKMFFIFYIQLFFFRVSSNPWPRNRKSETAVAVSTTTSWISEVQDYSAKRQDYIKVLFFV